MKVDLFARRAHFIDHMAPVWKALSPEVRGEFYVSQYLCAYAKELGVGAIGVAPTTPDPLSGAPNGSNPLLVCAYGDMLAAYKVRPQRPFILMEHGVGLTFANPSYAGGLGIRRRVSLFLVPNEHTRLANARVMPLTPQAIIGVPKMDEFASETHVSEVGDARLRLARPTVCISFHWDGKHIAPEAGNAYAHYASVLPELARQESFTLIGHGHPKFPQLGEIYASMGIEFVRDFREVMRRADVYVNDCSSTMYEFCVTGKPVIILNAPQFRRNVNHGIRFWDYSDVGPQVNQPGELLGAIERVLSTTHVVDMGDARLKLARPIASPDPYKEQKERAVRELYPFLGESAARAAECIEDFLASRPPGCKHVKKVGGESIGILYMGFGQRAALEIGKSVASLRRIGLDIPVAVVGDKAVPGTQWIPWKGESPFDGSKQRKFQFRAGRVKPGLCELTPFERTLYIDADTEFVGDIVPGFEMLDDTDMAVTEDSMMISQLHNRAGGMWEYNLEERDKTVEELDASASSTHVDDVPDGGGEPPRATAGDRKLFNSGVIFFRKCAAVEELFEEWGRQWLRWQEWDEQLALIRALNRCDVDYQVLSMDWNNPNRSKAKIIFHNYARGGARANIR